MVEDIKGNMKKKKFNWRKKILIKKNKTKNLFRKGKKDDDWTKQKHLTINLN